MFLCRYLFITCFLCDLFNDPRTSLAAYAIDAAAMMRYVNCSLSVSAVCLPLSLSRRSRNFPTHAQCTEKATRNSAEPQQRPAKGIPVEHFAGGKPSKSLRRSATRENSRRLASLEVSPEEVSRTICERGSFLRHVCLSVPEAGRLYGAQRAETCDVRITNVHLEMVERCIFGKHNVRSAKAKQLACFS